MSVLETIPSSNPLSSYFRQPKIFIRLPSHGEFYPAGSLDVSETGEYPVYAMTAKDELMFKTPDALMNGQATVEIIKSCVPAIVNPWAMPTIDIDAVLIAIRIATYGQEMELTAKCPACESVNDYMFDLVNYLGHLNSFTFEGTIAVDPLVIHIRPYNYRETTKRSLQALEQQKIMSVVNDENMSDDDKMSRFSDSFIKLTEMTVDIIAGCISAIDTPEGTVTDSAQIKDFIANSSSEVFNKVSKHVNDMRNEIEMKPQQVTCTECNHEFGVTLNMDQSNFFAVRS
jgi:hypothetical protein